MSNPADRSRFLTAGGILGLCALAWWYLVTEAARMDGMTGMAAMPGMDMGGSGMGAAWTAAELSYLWVMWSVMMVAMMLPSAAPTILLVARVGRERRSGVIPVFVSGYLVAWTAFSVLAGTVQWVLHGTLLVSDGMVSASPLLSGGLLVGAGIFQFTPLKDRCVSHCRSPLSWVMAHWREGAGGALRMGLHHGAYCVGCCWALMALLFVLGVMNLLWVTALAVLVLLEKTIPGGRWLTRAGGAALVLWGSAVIVGAV